MKKPAPTPLAKYRADKSLSLDALGEWFGVNKTTIMRWEQGKVPIPVKRLAKIAAVTGIPRERLRPDIYGAA